MTTDEPTIPRDVASTFGVTATAFIGGRVNRHWLVDTNGTRLVLRGAPTGASDASIDYELDVCRRLDAGGWPVPRPVESRSIGDRRWTLFTHLPGVVRRTDATADQRHARGRLLAMLHAATATLVDLGQREGWATSDRVVLDPALPDALRRYEAIRPDVGAMLRRHLDATIDAFARLPLAAAPRVVLHGDFAPWNLLRDEAGALTGVIDFAETHLNYRVADFALAWRGYQDEVIDGYESVSPLDELEHALVVPTFRAWLFLGVRDEIERMLAGTLAVNDFAWQQKQFAKRSDRWPTPTVAG